MKKRLLNKKGSSLIMVLGAMLILTAVGVLVILMSSANIRMSSKYNGWTEEYYDLDYAAQERLIQFDSNALVPAEMMARYYLQNNYFTYETVNDFPSGEDMAQALKTALWGSGLQEILHAKQLSAAELLIADETNPAADPQAAYDTAMTKLAEQTFSVLYFYQVNRLIGANTSAERVAMSNGIETDCLLVTPAWFPGVIPSDFDTLLADLTYPQIRVAAYEPTEADLPKQVDVRITLKSPGYKLSPQTRYIPLKINPLYTNAISAGGSVSFTGSGNVNIEGDVVSGNGGASKWLPENNTTGVVVTGSADVTVRGNIYSAGDVHIWGNGGKISVVPYEGYDSSLKDRLYQNDYYYGDSVVQNDDALKEDYNAAYVPYIYKDNGGGNVYCNSLAIEPGVGNATLSVSGDLWTQDDIQNDGATGTLISVGGTYIGMSSDASSSGDPNGSSAVINNAVLDGGQIVLTGDYIIPGTAFYVFNGGEGTPSNKVVYYQTAESASARTIESFSAYLSTGGGTTYFADASGEEAYILYGSDMSSLSAKIAYFKAHYVPAASGVNVKNNANYYSLGVSVDVDGTIRYAETSDYVINRTQYVFAQTVMPTVFKSKTQYFGTQVTEGTSAFESLLNHSFAVPDTGRGFYYYGGYDNSVTIGKGAGQVSSGIIYSEGNLTINGSGTFLGAVICRGNLTINGGVEIAHNVKAVLAVLGVSSGSNVVADGSGSRIARRFFSPTEPLTMGEDLGTEQIETVSVNAGERISMAIDRYTINAWKESHTLVAIP